METDRPKDEQTERREQLNESGLLGGGVGRREAPGPTGVHPVLASERVWESDGETYRYRSFEQLQRAHDRGRTTG